MDRINQWMTVTVGQYRNVPSAARTICKPASVVAEMVSDTDHSSVKSVEERQTSYIKTITKGISETGIKRILGQSLVLSRSLQRTQEQISIS